MDTQYFEGCGLTPPHAASVWLAAYTSPRHEKAVARHLESRQVENFLPLYRVVRRWKNGCNVPVELPLFPGYLFVRVPQRTESQLLNIPGLLTFVGAGRRASQIPDPEIEWLRNELPLRQTEPHAYLAVGAKVRIVVGPLAGQSGILVRRKNSLRVVLSVDLIRQCVAVEVGANEIEPL